MNKFEKGWNTHDMKRFKKQTRIYVCIKKEGAVYRKKKIVYMMKSENLGQFIYG